MLNESPIFLSFLFAWESSFIRLLGFLKISLYDLEGNDSCWLFQINSGQLNLSMVLNLRFQLLKSFSPKKVADKHYNSCNLISKLFHVH